MRPHQVPFTDKPIYLKEAKALMKNLKVWSAKELSTRMKLSETKAKETYQRALRCSPILEKPLKHLTPIRVRKTNWHTCSVTYSFYLEIMAF